VTTWSCPSQSKDGRQRRTRYHHRGNSTEIYVSTRNVIPTKDYREEEAPAPRLGHLNDDGSSVTNTSIHGRMTKATPRNYRPVAMMPLPGCGIKYLTGAGEERPRRIGVAAHSPFV
jgi:hypothetical protein